MDRVRTRYSRQRRPPSKAPPVLGLLSDDTVEKQGTKHCTVRVQILTSRCRDRVSSHADPTVRHRLQPAPSSHIMLWMRGRISEYGTPRQLRSEHVGVTHDPKMDAANKTQEDEGERDGKERKKIWSKALRIPHGNPRWMREKDCEEEEEEMEELKADVSVDQVALWLLRVHQATARCDASDRDRPSL
ncbi:hypothetical protein MUK42_05730 [Musa troglodytarum]|uniref:Uncharacterized protein n=1 Tax=Musa troglodytarum TaxID=320322 RepID=A0A9E7G7N7_9LILI|nr:hypothetical protein MUK42_05730 [Musa troglodytarum]